MNEKMFAHRVILDYLARNDEDNVATLVNAYQQFRKSEPHDKALREAIDAIADLGEGGQLDVWSNDPEQPLRVPEKVEAQSVRDRVLSEAESFSWDSRMRVWTSAAGPFTQKNYLWLAITENGKAMHSQLMRTQRRQ